MRPSEAKSGQDAPCREWRGQASSPGTSDLLPGSENSFRHPGAPGPDQYQWTWTHEHHWDQTTNSKWWIKQPLLLLQPQGKSERRILGNTPSSRNSSNSVSPCQAGSMFPPASMSSMSMSDQFSLSTAAQELVRIFSKLFSSFNFKSENLLKRF